MLIAQQQLTQSTLTRILGKLVDALGTLKTKFVIDTKIRWLGDILTNTLFDQTKASALAD